MNDLDQLNHAPVVPIVEAVENFVRAQQAYDGLPPTAPDKDQWRMYCLTAIYLSQLVANAYERGAKLDLGKE